MLPPTLHFFFFPPGWRENCIAVASGKVRDSATLLCCHLGQEPDARENMHNFYLSEFLSVRPLMLTTLFVILICPQPKCELQTCSGERVPVLVKYSLN